MQFGWIGASSGHDLHISANANNLILSDLYTEAQWAGGSTKTVVINPGVIIGSTTPAGESLSTGYQINGIDMGGTLRIINNGSIYGAGGAGTLGTGEVGGTALRALVPVEVTNNGQIYGGGGGGGVGGDGGAVHTYLDGTSYRYTGPAGTLWTLDDANLRVTLIGYQYSLPTFLDIWLDLPAGTVSYTVGGYIYERGTYQGYELSGYQFSLRRKKLNIPGGTGGSGGDGIGSGNVQESGTLGTQPTGATRGGTGGTGGNWGATGDTGETGGTAGVDQQDATTPTAGTAGGLGGYYINGDSFVTWDVTGSRLGRVTG